jgi:PIN domain nuclease of toxin-antitoxin system
LDLIFDTHALFWLAADHPKLSKRVVEQLADPDTRTFVSAVTLWEYRDLHRCGRLPGSVHLEDIQRAFSFERLDFPAEACSYADRLPDIHRDPIDRMLIAHAIAAELVLVTADRRLHEYPVPTLW